VSLQKKTDKNIRINDQIKASRVSVIEEDGRSAGTMDRLEALAYARSLSLDLVEVAPMAEPPVCRLMNYQREQYRQKKKLALQKKSQKRSVLKEIQLRPVIQEHDYSVKMNSVRRFLQEGDQVKIMVNFRGRELDLQKDRGFELLKRLLGDIDKLGRLDHAPKLEGRRIVVMLYPVAPSALENGKGPLPGKTVVDNEKQPHQQSDDKPSSIALDPGNED
jgi:translation initiation factor IF-3